MPVSTSAVIHPKPQTMMRHLNCFLSLSFRKEEYGLEKELPGGSIIRCLYIVTAPSDKLYRLLSKHDHLTHVGSKWYGPLLPFRSVPVCRYGGHHLYEPGAWEGIYYKHLRKQRTQVAVCIGPNIVGGQTNSPVSRHR